VVVRYELAEGRVNNLFADVPPVGSNMKPEDEAAIKAGLFQALREALPKNYECKFWAEDPNDPQNRKSLDGRSLRNACASGFISAQRGLDDASQKERVVIGKVLENLFNTAKSNEDDASSHTTAQQLEQAVEDIQGKIGADFNKKLDELLPGLALFGYPGLSDPKLRTETTLDVSRLLTNHTKVRYTGDNGVHLPEAYNGLGTRNIILILLQLREFFKLFLALKPRPCTHLVFIEEPEVHLHPQMQEVFIRKLTDIATAFAQESGVSWPVQFVVSTHSAHVANEARFECIRYFMSVPASATAPAHTKIKDLRKGLGGKDPNDREFLHQYLTLTRCDLLFADKAILIEGTTERLLLPCIIEQLDLGKPAAQQLSARYLSTVEVGGAYAHKFFDLLEFLELKTLIITDIDSVKPNATNKLVACAVHEGTSTSNACIKAWFTGKATDPPALLAATDVDKTAGLRRIAYQVPEKDKEPCGRSFEDAFMLANPALFANAGITADEKANNAWEEAKGVKKSEFALKHAIHSKDWTTPRYILEGLQWLALDSSAAAAALVMPVIVTKPAVASPAATVAGADASAPPQAGAQA